MLTRVAEVVEASCLRIPTKGSPVSAGGAFQQGFADIAM